jgi:hypothetical protein
LFNDQEAQHQYDDEQNYLPDPVIESCYFFHGII